MYVAITPSSGFSNFSLLPVFQIVCLYILQLGRVFSFPACVYTVCVGLTSMVTLNSKCSCLDSLTFILCRALPAGMDWPNGYWVSLGRVSSAPSIVLVRLLLHKHLCRSFFVWVFFLLFQKPLLARAVCQNTCVLWPEMTWGDVGSSEVRKLHWIQLQECFGQKEPGLAHWVFVVTYVAWTEVNFIVSSALVFVLGETDGCVQKWAPEQANWCQ